MTSIEDRLVALFEEKAGEIRHFAPLSANLARCAARARFVRRTGATVLAVAGVSTVVAFAGTAWRAPDTTHAPAANGPVPAPQLSGTSDVTEWRLTALTNGPEHCVIVRVSYEGRDIDTSYSCGVHAGDVEPDMGPGVTSVDGGAGTVGVLGQVGPAIETVAVETEHGGTTVHTMPLDWDTPPETRFYIAFVPRADTGTVSMYDAAGDLIREVELKFVEGDARVRE